MVYEGLLAYPGHPTWGRVLKRRSCYKSLEGVQARLTSAVAQEVAEIVSTLNESDRCTLRLTIIYLSDEQFDCMASRMQILTLGKLAFGIKLLARIHPSPMDHSLFPDLPETARKRKKEIKSGPDEATGEWSMLQQRVNILPLELFDMIKVMTLDSAFIGDIFPCQKSGVVVKDACIGEDINLKALGLIDRHTRQQYAERVWAENLWVLSTGANDNYPNPLGCLSPGVRRKIKRVLLEFSSEDFQYSNFVSDLSWHIFRRTKQPTDKWILFMEFDEKHNLAAANRAIASELLQIWEERASDIIGLELDELILDFKGTWRPDGSFLGVKLAKGLRRFRWDSTPWETRPWALKVEAPTAKLADTIHRILVGRYF